MGVGLHAEDLLLFLRDGGDSGGEERHQCLATIEVSKVEGEIAHLPLVLHLPGMAACLHEAGPDLRVNDSAPLVAGTGAVDLEGPDSADLLQRVGENGGWPPQVSR